jgi:hypothetical protein
MEESHDAVGIYGTSRKMIRVPDVGKNLVRRHTAEPSPLRRTRRAIGAQLFRRCVPDPPQRCVWTGVDPETAIVTLAARAADG